MNITTTPPHTGHITTTPQHTGHITTTPQHTGHITTTPQHTGHITTTPQHTGHINIHYMIYYLFDQHFIVTQTDPRSSLMMADYCRNM
jgi:hypothetical protein